MKNNWFKDMEKITICLGFAIIYLGVNNFLGNSVISPALVTGISLSGLFLTLADFLSKQFKDFENKRVLNVLYFIDSALYVLAALCIVGYPNATFITSLDKETLDWMSTSASVVALGFVFVAIGINNRKMAIEEDAKQAKEIQKIAQQTQKILDDAKEISKSKKETQELIREMQNETSELMKNKDKRIELLEKEIKLLKEMK
ncbi:hypothetical protein P3F89_27225 (plasmid) [Bacillus tropicus]|uniref:Uncharacterized protein n=1 Tax=Bacillus tropicus TaxID=2026188 RepID=A0ABD8A1A1_9BACI|nr:hypothetical protein [Bacillus tropicus]WMY18290.1 hypothetical protein P3F89_27225 [Bacillus tropicus]